MAMIVTLRDRMNNGIFSTDIEPGQTDPKSYPDVIVFEGKSYVMKQVARDKRSAFYMEATTMDIPGEA